MAQSRIEGILTAIIEGGDMSNLPHATSRNEALLLQVGEKMENIDAEKLAVNAGAENAGKLMGVGYDGTIAPAAAWGSGIVVTEAVISGEDYELSIAEEE